MHKVYIHTRAIAQSNILLYSAFSFNAPHCYVCAPNIERKTKYKAITINWLILGTLCAV